MWTLDSNFLCYTTNFRNQCECHSKLPANFQLNLNCPLQANLVRVIAFRSFHQLLVNYFQQCQHGRLEGKVEHESADERYYDEPKKCDHLKMKDH